jgi:thioredoxin-related protein
MPVFVGMIALGLLWISMALVRAGWTTNYKAALAEAKAENKLVLLDFTGSDWCGYCKLLHQQVFTTQDFKDFADRNYVLVTVDFPQQKQLPDEVKAQNAALQRQFKVNTYPTLIVVNANGKGQGREVGYTSGSGPGPVIARLRTINNR